MWNTGDMHAEKVEAVLLQGTCRAGDVGGGEGVDVAVVVVVIVVVVGGSSDGGGGGGGGIINVSSNRSRITPLVDRCPSHHLTGR